MDAATPCNFSIGDNNEKSNYNHTEEVRQIEVYTKYTHHNSRSTGITTIRFELEAGKMAEFEKSEEWNNFRKLLEKYKAEEQKSNELAREMMKREQAQKINAINSAWKETEKATPKKVRELHRELEKRYGSGFPFSMRYPLLSKILKRILLTAITAGCCVPAAIAGVIVGTHILMH